MNAAAIFDPQGRIIPLPTRAMFDIRLKPHHIMLLCFMSYQSERCPNGWFEVGIGVLASFFSKTRGAFTGPIAELEEWGYIEVQRRTQRGMRIESLYRIILDADLDDNFRRILSLDDPGPVQDLLVLAGAPQPQVKPDDSGRVIDESRADSGASGMADFPMTPPQTSENAVESRGVIADSGRVNNNIDRFSLESEKETESGNIANSLALLDVDLFERLIRKVSKEYYPDHPAPLFDRDLAARMVEDPLPYGLGEKLIRSIFARAVRMRHERISSLRFFSKGWAAVSQRFQANPQAPWDELVDDDPQQDKWIGFRDFCAAYPNIPDQDHLANTRLWDTFRSVLDRGTDPDQLVEAARAYSRSVSNTPGKFIKNPLNWLKEGSWRQHQIALGSSATSRTHLAPMDCNVPELEQQWTMFERLIGQHPSLGRWCAGIALDRCEEGGGLVFSAPNRVNQSWLTIQLGSDFGRAVALAFGDRSHRIVVRSQGDVA